MIVIGSLLTEAPRAAPAVGVPVDGTLPVHIPPLVSLAVLTPLRFPSPVARRAGPAGSRRCRGPATRSRRRSSAGSAAAAGCTLRSPHRERCEPETPGKLLDPGTPQPARRRTSRPRWRQTASTPLRPSVRTGRASCRRHWTPWSDATSSTKSGGSPTSQIR